VSETLIAAVSLVLLAAANPPARETPEARGHYRLCLAGRREENLESCRLAVAQGLKPDHASVVLQVQAYKLVILERWEEVAATYRELVRLRPRDALPHLHLGDVLLFALHDPAGALPSLQEAVRLEPSARAWVSLATALHALGRYAESVTAFERATALDPGALEERAASRELLQAARRGAPWP
jgi:tetratricopeptide (TPR) repeat protein